MYRSRISTIHPFRQAVMARSSAQVAFVEQSAPPGVWPSAGSTTQSYAMYASFHWWPAPANGYAPPAYSCLFMRNGVQLERGFMFKHGDPADHAQWGPPFLLYLGRAVDDLAIKTARGLAYWRPEWCIGQYRQPDCHVTLGLPDMEPAQAKAAGAETMVIGTANAGGVMPQPTVADIISALDAKLHVV